MQPTRRQWEQKLSWLLSVLSLPDFFPPGAMSYSFLVALMAHSTTPLRHSVKISRVKFSLLLDFLYHESSITKRTVKRGDWSRIKLTKQGQIAQSSKYRPGPQKACLSNDLENSESNQTHLCLIFSTCCLA